MEKLKTVRFIILIFYFFSLSAGAQSMTHYEIFSGNQFSLLKAEGLTDSTKIKLLSNTQKMYGFDIRQGSFGRAWYLHGEILQYDFRTGPTITPQFAENFTGTQSHYEFGRIYKMVKKLPIFFKLGVAYRESLYVDTLSPSLHLEKKGLPTLVFDLKFPIMNFGTKFSSDFKAQSGIFMDLSGSTGKAFDDADLKSIYMYSSKISFRKKIGDAFEFDFNTKYSNEHIESNLYDQTRTDLGFFFSIRYIPQPDYKDMNQFFTDWQ